MLQKDEADAVSLDATHTFIAGKCGLIPVVTEYYGWYESLKYFFMFLGERHGRI